MTQDGQKAGSEILINDAASMKTEIFLAHDGKNFLVTWTDDRNSRFDMTQSQGISIYGQLVSLDGFRVEDEISLATGIFNQTAPSITFNGYAFLLVWQRTPVQGCGSSIMAKIVFRSGVIPSPGFPVSQTASCNYVLDQPFVSADEDRFLVVWGKYKGKKDIQVFGQIVDTMGEPIGETILMFKPSLHHWIVPSHGFEENTEREPDLHF